MKHITRFLTRLCVVYTLSSVTLLLTQLAISGGTETTIIRPDAFLMILPFAALVALAQLIYDLPVPAHGLRLLIHFVLCMLSAYLFLYLPFNRDAGGANALLVTVLFAVLYWCIMGVYLAVRASTQKSRGTEQSTYQNIYKK